MAKGFKYTIEDEKIREYMKLSIEEKFKWLNEIQKFNQFALTDKEKEIMEKFKKAEI